MVRGKRGQDTTSYMPFVVLALVLIGLIIYGAYKFTSEGTDYLDASDAKVQFMLASCENLILSVNPGTWCSQFTFLDYAGGKQYLSCSYLNGRTGKTIAVPKEIEDKCAGKDEEYAKSYCVDLSKVATGNFRELVNGAWCEKKETDLTYGDSSYDLAKSKWETKTETDARIAAAAAAEVTREAFKKKCESATGIYSTEVCPTSTDNQPTLPSEEIAGKTYYCC